MTAGSGLLNKSVENRRQKSCDMLCSNQQCSYHHWVHHANYKVYQNTKSQRTNASDRRIFDKKDVIIGKILHEYRQKPPPTRSKKKKKHCMRSGVSGYDRTVFGKAQIIKRDRETGVLWAGSVDLTILQG